jgi:hypothetical protein
MYNAIFIVLYGECDKKKLITGGECDKFDLAIKE